MIKVKEHEPDESFVWADDNFDDLIVDFKEQEEDKWEAYKDEKFHNDMDLDGIVAGSEEAGEDIHAAWLSDVEEDLHDSFVQKFQEEWNNMVEKKFEER